MKKVGSLVFYDSPSEAKKPVVPKRKFQIWSKAEYDFMAANSHLSPSEMASVLGRSKSGVYSKLLELNLKYKPKPLSPRKLKLGQPAKSYRAYGSWKEMKARCYRPSNKSYADYAGKGITVCDRWKGPHSFVNFLEDMGERPEGTTLDRIDNKGNYEPSNCRWASYKTQSRNKSGNRNSSSKYKGVSWNKSSNKWRASYARNGKSIYIGDFKSEEAAAKAYNEAMLATGDPDYVLNDIKS